MNKNIKAVIAVAVIFVLVVINFLLADFVKTNSSLNLNISKSAGIIKKLDRPVDFKIIVSELDADHPIVMEFRGIAERIVALNKNITLTEIPYNSDEDMPNIEKYLNLAQENQEQLTPITIIIEEGENIAFATPEIDASQQNYDFASYDSVVAAKLQSVISPGSEPTSAETEPYTASNRNKAIYIVIYLFVIPALFVVLGICFSKKKCRA